MGATASALGLDGSILADPPVGRGVALFAAAWAPAGAALVVAAGLLVARAVGAAAVGTGIVVVAVVVHGSSSSISEKYAQSMDAREDPEPDIPIVRARTLFSRTSQSSAERTSVSLSSAVGCPERVSTGPRPRFGSCSRRHAISRCRVIPGTRVISRNSEPART